MLVIRERRPVRLRHGVLLQLLQGDLNGPLQLRIVPVVNCLGVHLHFHIGRRPLVLHVPLVIGIEETEIGRGHRAAVHQRRIRADPH